MFAASERDFGGLLEAFEMIGLKLSRDDPEKDMQVLYCIIVLMYYCNVASFYGSSCANNGKGALNTPETPQMLLSRSPCVKPTNPLAEPVFL